MFNPNDIVELQRQINLISRQNGLGELSIANSLMARGFNHRGLGNPVTTNLDNNGMVFFTRPNLNLSEANLLTKRVLSVLTTTNEYSIPRMIRAYLDPRGNGTPDIPRGAKRHNEGALCTTPLVDRNSPFIPLLTNNLLSLNGWKDIDMDSYTSPEGKARQTFSQIDSIGEILDSFTLTANFRNVPGDPITLMILTWLLYSGWVYRGDLMPYPESALEEEADYNTRIYRLVLDPSRRYVQKIACCGVSYPTAISIGASMNFNAEKPYMDDTAQITVPFRATGALYNDPIIIYWFNKITFNFCPLLKESVAGRSTAFVKMPFDSSNDYNYRGLPHINEETLELEWWLPAAEQSYFNALKGADAQLDTTTTTTGQQQFSSFRGDF